MEVEGINLTHFVENMDKARCGQLILGRPVIWVDELFDLAATHKGVCVFESPRRRDFVCAAADMGFAFTRAIHPSAEISRRVSVGEGAVIGPRVVVAGFSSIESHVFVNRGALIGHDTVIGSYSTIGPGAAIAGSCQIGAGTLIGMGAMILNGITVGSGATVCAGALVSKDVPPGTTVAGSPARSIRRNEP